MDDLHGKKIAILGGGTEGKSTYNYLVHHGLTATILNETTEEPFPDLTHYDVIFRSPGVPVTHPRILEAKLKGRTITSNVNYFITHSPTTNIIGVTGTKGKGTTSTLIHLMLKNAGHDSFLGGNIGTPPLDFMNEVAPNSWVVLELSSFQLIDIEKSPHIAVVLMTTSEHLDWHASVDEYIAAKANITVFQNQSDAIVANMDYSGSKKILSQSPATRLEISTKGSAGTSGCYVRNNQIIYRSFGQSEIICPTSVVRLPGRHNLENVCAAVCAARVAGVSQEAIVHTLETFTGLEHRIEFVREVGGVKYYDDSFSTTPDTTIAAIESFEAPKVLILGGSTKKSDFTAMARVINRSKSIRAIIGIGVEWPRIMSYLGNTKVPLYEGYQTINEVIDAARQIAAPGDIVILSPACASFDMFHNYKERGERFKEAVSALP